MIFLLLFICVCLNIPSFAYAAPAMSSHVCEITAIVQKIEKRKEKYHDESWRKSWGLLKYRKYVDVTVSVKSASMIEQHMMGECTLEALSGVLQLRSDIKPSKIPVGTCFTGKTQFSGDEFSIGQWLFDVTKLPKSKCTDISE